ncbi:MAG TPA: hypothetical protein VIE43_12315 [Thermoanaerobaculia bacterium]|nr:hypothetical protein [Thermoanaerobaculia bacterium]
MIRTLSRVLLLAAALLAAHSAATHSAAAAACTVTLRCPNGQILSCPSTPCSRLDNCGIRCNGAIERCSGTCIIQ